MENGEKTKICDIGEQRLAREIIIREVEDFRDAFWGRDVGGVSAEIMMNDCLRFFRSNYFKKLSDINADYLIKTLKITEYENAITIYKKATELNIERKVKIKIFIEKTKKNKAIEYEIPPRLEKKIKEVMKEQIKEMERELREINLLGNEQEGTK